MAVYDSLGNYVLFSTISAEKTRLWSRDTTAGSNTFYPEKLKYYVLKNTPSTVPAVPTEVTARNLKTVVVSGKTYAIDINIYDALVASMVQNPITTLEQLKERIVLVRAQLGIKPPVSVQLQGVPLRNLIKRYQYPLVSDQWQRSSVAQPKVTGSSFRLGNIVTSAFAANNTSLPYINYWAGKFQTRKLNLNNAQYFYGQKNDGFSYTRTYAELFTTASRAGATILPQNSLLKYTQTGIIDYDPFPTATNSSLSLTLAFLVPDTPNLKVGDFPAKFGAIFVASTIWTSLIQDNEGNPLQPVQSQIASDVAANSELIFIPLQTDLDIIENLRLTPMTGCSFPVTNGGDLTISLPSLVQTYKNNFADYLTAQNSTFTL